MSKRARESGAGAASSGYPGADNARAAKGVQEQRRATRLTREGPVNPDTKDFCGAFAALDLDNSWDLGAFRKGFSIEITSMSEELVTFDMVGIDPPLANAFRRILIAEVSTVAISNVTIYQNTGVIHDENLAHRLGLVPIKFEPELLKWREPDAGFDEDSSVVFTLRVACEKERRSVYSGDLVWEPMSDAQRERFKDDPPRPVDAGILLAKLGPGQEIECICHCERGIGRSHAKWSPVCTATYRLLPELQRDEDAADSDAPPARRDPKSDCCIFDLDPSAQAGASRRSVAAGPRKCSAVREGAGEAAGEVARGLRVVKLKDHYLFSIEAVGQLPATVLFDRALQRLKEKCKTAKSVLQTQKEE